jgi:hypothetical protein
MLHRRRSIENRTASPVFSETLTIGRYVVPFSPDVSKRQFESKGLLA